MVGGCHCTCAGVALRLCAISAIRLLSRTLGSELFRSGFPGFPSGE